MNQGHPQQELPRDPDDEAYGGYPEYEEESEWPEPLGPSFFEEYGIDYQHIPVRLPQDTHRPHFTLPNNNFTSRSFSTHSPPISRHDSPNLPSFESLTDLDLASFAGTGERPRSPTPFPGLENSPQFPRQSRRRSRPSSTSISLSSSLTPRSTSTTAFVDLTSNTPIMPQPHRATKRSALQASTSTHNSSKKRKTAVKSEIDEIDLLDVDSDTDLARVLEKQRVNTVKAQQEEADKPTKLANLTCVVCMEEMTNMTATHCGTFISFLTSPMLLTFEHGTRKLIQ